MAAPDMGNMFVMDDGQMYTISMEGAADGNYMSVEDPSNIVLYQHSDGSVTTAPVATTDETSQPFPASRRLVRFHTESGEECYQYVDEEPAIEALEETTFKQETDELASALSDRATGEVVMEVEEPTDPRDIAFTYDMPEPTETETDETEIEAEKLAKLKLECQSLGDENLLALSSHLLLQTAKRRGDEFVNYMGKNFVRCCLEASEILSSSSCANVLALLAGSLQNELLSTESPAFLLIETMLLSLENNIDTKSAGFNGVLDLLQEYCNHSVVDFVNRVIFPNQTSGFVINSDDGTDKVAFDQAKPEELGAQIELVPDSVEEVVHNEDDGSNDADAPQHEENANALFECTMCSTKFELLEDARKHERSGICLTCPTCKQAFPNREEWKPHVLMHKHKDHHLCRFCGKIFNKKENLQRHYRTVHLLIKAFTCTICNKSFTERNSLRDHTRIHTGERPFVCEICNSPIRTRALYTRHMMVTHGLKQKEIKYPKTTVEETKCPSCDRTFKRLSALERHQKQFHSGRMDYVCGTCGKLFAEQSSLNEHSRIHTGEKPFQCGKCGDKFRTKGLHDRHIAFKHPNDNEVKVLDAAYPESIVSSCEICGKVFKNAVSLERHIYVMHKSKRGHNCDICGSTFKTARALDGHIMLHKGDNPYLCTRCPKAFRTRQQYRLHTSSNHGLICEFCDEKFKTLHALTRHRREHDETMKGSIERFPCQKCNKTFQWRYQRERHFAITHRGMKKHICKICDKRTNNLNEHMAIHDRRIRFVCEICDEGFIHRASYKRHVVRHKGNQRFSCPICKKTYDTPDYVRSHITRVHKDVKVDMKFTMPGASLLDHMKKNGNRGGRKPKDSWFGILGSEIQEEVEGQVEAPSLDKEYSPMVDHQYQSHESKTPLTAVQEEEVSVATQALKTEDTEQEQGQIEQSITIEEAEAIGHEIDPVIDGAGQTGLDAIITDEHGQPIGQDNIQILQISETGETIVMSVSEAASMGFIVTNEDGTIITK